MHALIWAVEERLAGTIGNPTLQVGGVQDAVIVADPGDAGLVLQDCVHPVPMGKTPGNEEVQVKGTLLRMGCLSHWKPPNSKCDFCVLYSRRAFALQATSAANEPTPLPEAAPPRVTPVPATVATAGPAPAAGA